MWGKLLGLFIGPIIKLIGSWLQKAIAAIALAYMKQKKYRKIKKEAKETLNEIMSEKDPAVRARRLRDYLS
jgi:hypothetical protein